MEPYCDAGHKFAPSVELIGVPVGFPALGASGRLLAVADGRVRIDVGDQVYEVPVGEVEKAHLVYEFSPSKEPRE